MQSAEGGSIVLLDISDSVTSLIIEGYTREAGVRSLERALAALCRAVAVRVAEGDVGVGAPLVATPELVTAALGPPRFGGNELSDQAQTPGVVAGLVWTEAGGLVQHVEASALTPQPGVPGRLQLTGTLGDVIKESAQIAYSWVRSRANALRLRVDPAGEEDDESGKPPLKGAALLAARDVHVHLPQGAVPKDGPSAGITLATALCSLFSGVPPRADTAMTGELTLSGLVLPVGGIRDKLMAAQRARLTRVLIPARNMPDVAAEVPIATQEALTIIPVPPWTTSSAKPFTAASAQQRLCRWPSSEPLMGCCSELCVIPFLRWAANLC
jgi:ATP-dependent Lon protease